MWKIRDPEALKEKINYLLSDEIVTQGCNRQMDDNSDYILLSCGEVDIKLKKESIENVPEYNPTEWNPYPQVRPPRSGRYFIYLDNSGWSQRLHIGTYDADTEKWRSVIDRSVIFFKECNEKEPE